MMANALKRSIAFLGFASGRPEKDSLLGSVPVLIQTKDGRKRDAQ